MRVLVVEDEATMQRLLLRILEEERYVVDCAATADEGTMLALTNDYDGLIVDLELPDGHGVDIVKAVRAQGRLVPILMFTARGDSDEIIAALDAGADDYLTKPSDVSLIKARVRALVRRGRQQANARAGVNVPLCVGNVVLNVAKHRVMVGDTIVQVTPKELLLLRHLMLRVGEVVQRSELLEKVWDMNFDPNSNVIDTHVSRLRTKLREAGAAIVIRGVRATGFILEPKAS